MSSLDPRPDTELLAERVIERTAGPCRVLTLHTPVRSVVSWRGSFYTYPDQSAREDLVQDLAVSLLDKGTRSRDRFAVAELLENRGAQLQFFSDGLRVGFSGKALREDVPAVLEVLAEQLREPLFDAVEFDKARARMAASVQRMMESTGAQAGGALSRALYPHDHPNYRFAPEDDLQRLLDLSAADVRSFHAEHFGSRDLTLVLVGDLDDAAIDRVLAGCFAGWQDPEVPARFAVEGAPARAGRSLLPMPDKQNTDIRLGHALHVRRQDADYMPLYLGNYVLGGNFSARLMTSIRDEQGLTYGIGSNLSGITTDYAGHWQVAVTLSEENVGRGLEATLAETRRFVEEGVTEGELADKKMTITGSFKVGMATTGGLAAALLNNAERGFEVDYLDRFPDEVDGTRLEAVNEAVRRHLRPDALHEALAGAVDVHEDTSAE
jgi:zinc protease